MPGPCCACLGLTWAGGIASSPSECKTHKFTHSHVNTHTHTLSSVFILPSHIAESPQLSSTSMRQSSSQCRLIVPTSRCSSAFVLRIVGCLFSLSFLTGSVTTSFLSPSPPLSQSLTLNSCFSPSSHSFLPPAFSSPNPPYHLLISVILGSMSCEKRKIFFFPEAFLPVQHSHTTL